MTWETGSTDQQRLRAGYAVLMVGVFILMFAWGMAVMREPLPESETGAQQQKLDPPAPNRILPAVGAGMLLTGLCLFAVLAISVFAFIKMSRNYRDRILRPPARPTPTTDVWQMHKVPEMPLDDDGNEAGDIDEADADEDKPV